MALRSGLPGVRPAVAALLLAACLGLGSGQDSHGSASARPYADVVADVVADSVAALGEENDEIEDDFDYDFEDDDFDDDLDDDTPGYGEGPEYWDKRYADDPVPFDWLRTFDDIRELVGELTNNNMSARIMLVGCGNSNLAEEMNDAGYTNLLNIDTSSVVIQQMAERHRDRPAIKWMVMDATATDFDDESIDLVIDKAFMDTLVCTPHSDLVVARYLREMRRVLRRGSHLLCLSFGSPEERLRHFAMPHLDFSVRQGELEPRPPPDDEHIAYMAQRSWTPQQATEDAWPVVLKALEEEL